MDEGKHIYYLDSGYNIREIVRIGDVNPTWTYHELQWAAAINSNISAGSRLFDCSDFSADDMRVYYLTSDQHIHELAYSSGDNQWYLRDVTKDSNAPPAAPGSALASASYKDREMRVYYLTSDCWWSGNQHICELALKTNPDASVVWTFRDVTKELNAPPAAPGSALASAIDTNGEICVYYLTNDQHICELTSKLKPDTGLVWSFQDITLESNAPPAAPGSALASAKCKGKMRVYYLAGDCQLSESQHIYELATKNEQPGTAVVWPDSWAFRDVTKESNVPPTAPGSALASANYSDDEIRIYYLVVWNHICELAIKADGSWSSLDVTVESNAPPAALGSMLASSSNGALVYYLTDDQRIVELASMASGWRSLDVTKESNASLAAPGRTLKLMDYKQDKKGPK